MTLSTQSLAAATARNPWRTIGVWAAAALLAIGAIGALLGGNLTTEGQPTNDPQSLRAKDVLARAFPASESSAVTDVVVVRSERYTTGDPEFQRFVARLTDEGSALGGSVTQPEIATSEDGRALLVGVAFASDTATDEAIEEVARADGDPELAVSIAGDETIQHDFNLLSQEDLEKGEIQFGLPAALVILLLVFGAVVAGLVPLFMAIVSIVVALGIVALIAQVFTLSVFVVNMLTGMGLALGIDYSLFVVSRYR